MQHLTHCQLCKFACYFFQNQFSVNITKASINLNQGLGLNCLQKLQYILLDKYKMTRSFMLDKYLNADLNRNHIVNSPSCQCGQFESAAHFQLHCPIFMNERQSFYLEN